VKTGADMDWKTDRMGKMKRSGWNNVENSVAVEKVVGGGF